MTLTAGEHIDLLIDKPAAGGRMIARHDGQVVLVQGAVPGEQVTARVDRVEKRLAFATTVDVRHASPDRRAGMADPSCGGCVYSHIAYARQLAIKADVIGDAFLRLGRIALEEAIAVAASPERGYRLRARLHVRDGRAGFYREGTHAWCDARPTDQLTVETIDAVDGALEVILSSGAVPVSVEVSENMPGAQRALSIALQADGGLTGDTLALVLDANSVTGCAVRRADGVRLTAGLPAVSDSLALLTRGRAARGAVERHPESFFQANRFLLPDLVGAVLDSVPPTGAVLDLYAGVGLFALALAATGRSGIVAIEGDMSSGADLLRNASSFAPALRVVLGRVEDYVRRRTRAPGTVIVDPPRTGISRDAMGAIAGLGAREVVYVSCDPPTLARDARRLLDAGYRLRSLRAFDLFPNTPHVECLAVFSSGALQSLIPNPSSSNP